MHPLFIKHVSLFGKHKCNIYEPILRFALKVQRNIPYWGICPGEGSTPPGFTAPNALSLSFCCLHSSIISYNFFIPLYSSVALMLLCNTCLTEPQESWLNLTLLLLLLLACTCAVDQQPQWLVFFKFMTVNLKWALFVLPPCPSLLSQTVLFFNGIIFNYYYNFYWYH